MGAALEVRELGTVPYAEALALQEELREARRRGACPDTLLLLEHPPVITLGRSHRPENLLLDREALAERGVEIFEVARGGDVTYHAPGQLVGYPIVDLAARGSRDVHAWLRTLEEGVGAACSELGVGWRRVAGWTGVFVDEPDPAARPRKLASIGVGLRGWVTHHGFALDVDLDLGGFDMIVPCGLGGVEMTSLARELGARVARRPRRPRPRRRASRLPGTARIALQSRTRSLQFGRPQVAAREHASGRRPRAASRRRAKSKQSASEVEQDLTSCRAT